MNKALPGLLGALAALPSQPVLADVPAPDATLPQEPSAVTWELAFTEDFDGTELNGELWTRIGVGRSDWNRNMSLRPDLVEVKDGELVCWGVRNDDLEADPRPVLTGGVQTQNRFAMKYGKIEFRMKIEDGQKGAWPAVWMMPQTRVRGWPNDGEIDIIERLNSDPFVYHTLHFGEGVPGHKQDGGKGPIRTGDWNVYGLEWTPEGIVWTVNGQETFRHMRRTSDDAILFPWTTPFYLMIDMQLGGDWVGSVDPSTLPVALHVDWVKFYHGVRDGRRLSEFVFPQKADQAK